MSQSDATSADPKPEISPIDLEEQSRQSMQALGNLIERISAWLFAFGSWIFGGLIAFNLLVLASLFTIGPIHPAILVSLTLTGMVSVLWYMAWWVGVVFFAMVLVSQVLVIIVIAHSLPPESEAEKEQKRRYREHLARQRKGQRKAEQERQKDGSCAVISPPPSSLEEAKPSQED